MLLVFLIRIPYVIIIEKVALRCQETNNVSILHITFMKEKELH
jgi:hypothetical protein